VPGLKVPFQGNHGESVRKPESWFVYSPVAADLAAMLKAN
jgi:hypothetical protein